MPLTGLHVHTCTCMSCIAKVTNYTVVSGNASLVQSLLYMWGQSYRVADRLCTYFHMGFRPLQGCVCSNFMVEVSCF